MGLAAMLVGAGANIGLIAILLLELAFAIVSRVSQGARGPYTSAIVNAVGNTQLVGRLLFTDFLIPFEITSIILLIAIVGAMIAIISSR